ncbi:MAG: PLP-dependent aminotransferase family protein [Nocardioidaceae bacterium]
MPARPLTAASAARVATLLGSAVQRSPAYLGLADGLRLLVSDGRLPTGTRLPSERDLTTALGVSRTTVTRAYAVLRERGYLESRRGSRSVTRLPAPRGGGAQDHLLSPGSPEGDVLDLTVAAPVAPAGVAAAYERALEQLPAYLSGTGYFPSGLPVLREALADRFTARGLPTSADQVVVTSGALAGVAMTARALTSTGDRVLAESPTYPNAIATWRRSGARLVGVGVEPDGWDLDAMTAALRQVSPRAAYLVPDFHNPTGSLMDDEQRARLGHALARARTTAVVDETLVEIALDDVTMPSPLAVHEPGAVTVGSASKAFWGGLRIGWVRAPLDQVGGLVAARLSLDLGAAALEQLTLVELLRDAEAVARTRRERLVASRAALIAGLHEHLPDWTFVVPAGGLALWCRLPEPLSSSLAVAAEREGVLVAPGPTFAPEGGFERFVRLPYTRSPDELTEATRRLARAWADARRHRGNAAARSPLVA